MRDERNKLTMNAELAFRMKLVNLVNSHERAAEVELHVQALDDERTASEQGLESAKSQGARPSKDP